MIHKHQSKFTNQLYRLGLSLGIFAGTFVLAFVAASALTPVDSSSAAESGSGSLTMAFTSEQNIGIAVNKDSVGINAGSADFNKMLTDSLNVTVSTNNVTGYTLNMSTDSSATNGATITSGGTTQENVATNALVNTADNKFYIPSITSSVTNPTDSTFPVNSWAYSISSTPTNMVYSPLPAAGSSEEIKKVTELDFPTDGSEATVDDSTPITVATKADMSVPAGTYTNKLVFTAVTNYNPEYDSYDIVYAPNGESGDGTSGTIGGSMSSVSHTAVAPGSEVNLYAPNFWRSGYGFLGWSSVPNASAYISSTQAAASNITTSNTAQAIIYGPNETITLSDADMDNASSARVITMYAIWKQSAGNMQSWTGCNAMNVGDVTALTDTRDNNTYAVAKLADGNCWFAENLRLSSGTIDSTTTNNPISGFAWTESSNDWCSTDNAECDDKVVLNTNNINVSLPASPDATSGSVSWYNYGTYYNWYAATAGRGTYSMDSGETAGDICPLGWHLPTSTVSGEFQYMHNSMGAVTANLYKYPNNFTFSGNWWENFASGRGFSDNSTWGNFWSSTARDNSYAYYAAMQNNGVDMSWSFYKFSGRSVRCIANYKYNVTVSAGTGVTGTPTGGGSYKVGDTVTLGGLSAASGYHDRTWTVTSGGVTLSSVTADNPTFTMPANDVEISASASPNTYTIAYSANGGSGSIASVTKTYDETVTIPATSSVSRPGYYAAPRWAKASDSVAPTYASGNIAVSTLASGANVASANNATITLYAKWLQNCDYGGTSAFRLADNMCWTRTSQGSVTWDNAAAKCHSGFSLPSKDQFSMLTGAYGGNNGNLYNTTGWYSQYWSSTEYASNTSNAWYLNVIYFYSYVSYGTNNNKTYSYDVVCVRS